MSADRLAEIRARWAQTTPGPWLWDGSPTQPAALFNPHEGVIIFEAAGEDRMRWPSPNRVTDQSAIAAAPEDIAWLCAEVERQAKLLTAAHHALRSYQYHNASPDLAREVADAIEGQPAP